MLQIGSQAECTAQEASRRLAAEKSCGQIAGVLGWIREGLGGEGGGGSHLSSTGAHQILSQAKGDML